MMNDLNDLFVCFVGGFCLGGTWGWATAVFVGLLAVCLYCEAKILDKKRTRTK